MNAPAHLRIPMTLLQHIEDIESFEGLSVDRVAMLSQDYSLEELTAIGDALLFAVEHPEFDFLSLMPNLPFSNQQIHIFLCKVFISITKPPEPGAIN